jgi:hypothetical protein
MAFEATACGGKRKRGTRHDSGIPQQYFGKIVIRSIIQIAIDPLAE